MFFGRLKLLGESKRSLFAILPVAGAFVAGCDGFTAADARQQEQLGIVLPASEEWTQRGVVVPLGSFGEWDFRIDGAFTPSTVTEKNGTLHLYYIGGDGNRRTDGGPRHRKLGLATSTDGLTWTKHPSNPILTHQAGIADSEESGIFSAGAALDADGTLVLYFGGMEEFRLDSVDSDAVLATSEDGVNFTMVGDVIDHRNRNVWRHGDEIFPVGAYRRADGTWFVYYVGKGNGREWDLGLASGLAKDALTTFEPVLDLQYDVKNGGDPIAVSDDSIIVPIGVYRSGTAEIQLRTTTADKLHVLETVAAVYTFGDVLEFTLYLDHHREKWLLFYITPQLDGIHLRTAAVRYQ